MEKNTTVHIFCFSLLDIVAGYTIDFSVFEAPFFLTSWFEIAGYYSGFFTK
jgi:hypothetical protein